MQLGRGGIIPYSRNISREKTFANWYFIEKNRISRHKRAKFAKVFSLESFTLYGTKYIESI